GIRDFHVTGVQTCALPISLAAWIPYRAAAAGPFNTDILSTSAGLMSDALLMLATSNEELVELSMGIPSTTNKGWLFPVMEDPPSSGGRRVGNERTTAWDTP